MATNSQERGAGLISSFLGALAFLAFLALATHTLVSLYATSVLTAATWDETRTAASKGQQTDPAVRIRSRLSNFDDLTVQSISDGQSVATTVRAKRPSLLPSGLAESVGLSHIERTVVVRKEDFR